MQKLVLALTAIAFFAVAPAQAGSGPYVSAGVTMGWGHSDPNSWGHNSHRHRPPHYAAPRPVHPRPPVVVPGYPVSRPHQPQGGELICPPLGSPEFLRLNPQPQGREGCEMVEKVPGKPCGGWWCPRTANSQRLPGY